MWVSVRLKFSWNLQETQAGKWWSYELIFERNKQPWGLSIFRCAPVGRWNESREQMLTYIPRTFKNHAIKLLYSLHLSFTAPFHALVHSFTHLAHVSWKGTMCQLSKELWFSYEHVNEGSSFHRAFGWSFCWEKQVNR